ncbi:MAG: CoA pyrophosphatase [Dehalococcoidia bacterium]|nr:CoA pyrophosphatase [Dehalococcoidia bacterium]HRC62192.1 CoA pyrophosphatase [Dehalococcoidia bacterium]
MRDLIRDVVSRHEPILVDPTKDHMPAAVLLLLHERDGVEHLLFQVRSQHVEFHKGEISLPGGGRDPEDESLLMTALRETEEEIGVHRSHVEVFGRLDDVVTRTNFAMSPYVGAITAETPYPFRIASIEMEMLLEVPVPYLLSGEGWEYMTTPIGEMRNYRHGDHLIFGATARVVSQLVDKLIEAQGGSLSGAQAALR